MSYYQTQKFSYYHLIAAFVLGLIGGFLINNLYQHHRYQNLLASADVVSENRAVNLKNVANVADTIIKIDKQTAFNSVWNLPQVQRKAKEIENLSKGAIGVSATVDSYPSADKPFYIVKVFEKHPDQTTSPVYWFRVSSYSGVIQPLDLVENQYIDIEKWNPDGR
ncbi:MAG: hypothetical protein EAZ76_13375 [Nostocales cyanobacterium]|nr:MAG: hypothetical protein EAZ87_02930 [Nostocales cyanobacterium]TAF12716.1 MAG: hypothetical protein EAZ76_13375 [Nostocales cyanobacterium]